MAEIDEVRRTLHAYCRLLDERRLDDLADIYLPEAVDDRKRATPLVGIDQIRDYFERSMKPLVGTAHILTNVDVTIDESGERATSYSRVLAFHWVAEVSDDPVRPTDFMVLGSYDDQLVKTPEGWRIARRVVGALGPAGLAIGDLPAMYRGFGGKGASS